MKTDLNPEAHASGTLINDKQGINGKTELAVIILNWNGRKLLEQFIPAATRFTIGEGVRLIVADNGSTDDSVEWLKANYPDVDLIIFPENLGFAEGYNRAIEMTDSEYVILLNSDVEVTEGWFLPMLDFMRSHPDAGACQPKIKSFRDRTKFEYAGAAGGLLDRLGYPYCRGRVFDNLETDNGQYDDKAVQIAWASGAALMVRRKAYIEVGGLDSSFFAHMEEIDLCLRMIGSGWGVWFVPGAEVYHVGGASLPKDNPKKTYLNFRNNLLMLHKNMPRREGKRLLFVRRLADTLAFFMYVAKLDLRNAKAVLKAHADYKRMRKNYTVLPERDYLRNVPGHDRLILLSFFSK